MLTNVDIIYYFDFFFAFHEIDKILTMLLFYHIFACNENFSPEKNSITTTYGQFQSYKISVNINEF